MEILKTIKNLINGKHKEKKIRYTPPWRIPYVGNKKLTPEQQRELFQLNEWILKTLKQDWKENHLK